MAALQAWIAGFPQVAGLAGCIKMSVKMVALAEISGFPQLARLAGDTLG